VTSAPKEALLFCYANFLKVSVTKTIGQNNPEISQNLARYSNMLSAVIPKQRMKKENQNRCKARVDDHK